MQSLEFFVESFPETWPATAMCCLFCGGNWRRFSPDDRLITTDCTRQNSWKTGHLCVYRSITDLNYPYNISWRMGDIPVRFSRPLPWHKEKYLLSWWLTRTSINEDGDGGALGGGCYTDELIFWIELCRFATDWTCDHGGLQLDSCPSLVQLELAGQLGPILCRPRVGQIHRREERIKGPPDNLLREVFEC